MIQKLIIVIVLVLGYGFSSICLGNIDYNPPKKSKRSSKYKAHKYSSMVMKERLDNIGSAFNFKLNKEVKRYIRSYVKRGRTNTEKIIGRSIMYFPIFDYYLEKHDLPPELRYITIIESALIPDAKSPVGAAGLWQFMPRTAKGWGLEINNYVDERLDPHKASEAAAKKFKKLYRQFKDWNLAIAAYNCGAGRVRAAIRKGGSRDFWKIRKHLPKETQGYVPKFMAAAYVMNYYLYYDLHPAYPDYDLQIVNYRKVYKRNSFNELAQLTGIELETIKRLNPSYKKDIIPPSSKGSNIILPRIIPSKAVSLLD